MIGVILLLYLIGFAVIVISHGNGFLHYFYFDILGIIIAGCGNIVLFYRLWKGGAMRYFQMPKHNKPLFEFLYRIGYKRPIYGKRIPGTGFSDIHKHGLVQELGRKPSPGSVYHHGDHLVQFALQDIGHTPNPAYAGFVSFLDEIGFDDIHGVHRVLNGYDPYLMIKIWKNLNKMDENGGTLQDSTDLFVERLQNLTDKDMEKYPKKFYHNPVKKNVNERVDALLSKKQKDN